MVDLVQAEHLTRGRVELVMIDLQRCQRRVEGELDVGGPRRILQRLQHCDEARSRSSPLNEGLFGEMLQL